MSAAPNTISAPGSMLEHALGAAKLGFKVLPLSPSSKTPPLVSSWPELATTDEATIRAWWNQHPAANVGVHCGEHNGRHLVVIDVDPAKGGGDTWKALGGPLIKTRKHDTPSRGLHAFFYAPQPMRNSVETLGPGIDTRGVSGYVVWPGSATAAGRYKVRDAAPIADLPAAWLEKLGAAKPKPERQSDAPAISTDEDAAVERARDFLRSHPPAIEGKGGDAHTYATICRIRDLGVPEHRATEALADWNARCVPPWEPSDLEQKISNAWSYAQEPAGKLTPEALGFEAIASWIDPVPGSDVAQARAELQKVADAARDEIKLCRASDTETPKVWQDNYLVKGWLWKGIDAQIFGPTNVGKTFLALHLGVHVAAGAPWFEQRTRQGGVLYLPYEGLMALPRRLAALKIKYPDLPWSTMPFAWVGMNAPLVKERALDHELPGNKRMQAAILAFAAEFGAPPALVIVDTYSRAIGGSASDEGLAGKFAGMARALSERYGTTMLRVHHPGHTNTERSRGSYAIGAGLDVDIRVSEGLIDAPKQRDAEKNRLGFKLEIVDLGKDQDGDRLTSCAVVPGPVRNELDLTGPQQAVMHVIRTLAGNARAVSRSSGLEAARKASVVPEADAGRKKFGSLLEQLHRKQYITFDAREITLLERGAGGYFDAAEDSD